MAMVQIPEGMAVSTQGQHYVQYKEGLIWLITFCKLDNLFLTSQASKLYQLVAFYGVVKDRFSTKTESMKSATAFLLISSASIISLAMPDLTGTPKDKKVQFIVFKTRTKRNDDARNYL